MLKCEKCGESNELRSTDKFNELTKKYELWIICPCCHSMQDADTDEPASRALRHVEYEHLGSPGNPGDFLENE